MNETKDGESSATYNSVINAPGCFKPLKYGKSFLNNLDVMCEQACMTTQQVKYQ